MKTAQEIRAGNVIMQGKDPMVVLKTEYHISRFRDAHMRDFHGLYSSVSVSF